jgi:hypothetical protein
MVCTTPWVPGPFLSNAGAGYAWEHGLRFTAKAQYFTGARQITGSGIAADWSGVTCRLWRVSTQGQVREFVFNTGLPNTVYDIVLPQPTPLIIGEDYVLSIEESPNNKYVSTNAAVLPAEDATMKPILWTIHQPGLGIPLDAWPSTWGIVPQLCTSTGGLCTYGTRLKPLSQFIYYLTPGLIDAWLTSLGAVWLAPLFTAWWFTALDTQELCRSGPPDVSFLTSTDPAHMSSSQILTLLKAVAWSQNCECVPGSPDPTPYPPPTFVQPPGWVLPVLPSCANSDICSMLTQLYAGIAALGNNLGRLRTELEVMQRYSTPFAYIPGANHSDLSGDGSFAIPRCIGVQVTVTTRPATHVSPGNPPYIYNLGWVAVNTSGGLVREHRVSRDLDVWIPTDMQLATVLTFHFNPGVVCSVQELYAEP